MKTTKINIEVTLDEQNIPEKIVWQADDSPKKGLVESKAIALSFWDEERQEGLSLDLWTKEMPVDEMKKFYINILGSASNSILNATGDEYMSTELANLCEKFVEHLKRD